MGIKIENVDFHKKFGARVKELREIKGVTQEELSYLIGVESSSYINKIENTRINPSLAKIKKIADILGVEAKELFDF